MTPKEELNQLDLLMLINTAMIYKITIENEAADKVARQQRLELERKIDRILELLENGNKQNQ